MSLRAQNMKTGPKALGTIENDSGSAKHENGTRRRRYRRKRFREGNIYKRDPTPSVPPKTSPTTQNMKTGPDALGTAENESGLAKRDPTPSILPKMSPGAQNMKTGPDTLDAAENESGSIKNENGTRRPQYR
jgi:hypothetical protein